jgi:uncharacterized membrane protein (DUF485 family)
MSHWDHGGGTSNDDAPHIAARNARVGMILFVFYSACYAAFVLTCVFAPERMAARPWAGINLAIWSGFGLLLLALVMSLLYSWLCRERAAS